VCEGKRVILKGTEYLKKNLRFQIVRGMRLVVAMFSLLDGILMTLKKSQDSRIQMCGSINAARSRPHARPSQGRPTVACILRVLVLSVRIMQVILSVQVSTTREG